MKVRRCTEADLDGYLAVQEEEWGESMSASRAQLTTRFEHAGDLMLVVEHGGEVVGAASFVRLPDYDVDDHLSWEDATDGGWCTNTDPDGRVLFGVDLSVSRRAPRLASARLMASCLELTMRTGVEALYWGSRLPRYHRHVDEMSADEYIRAKTRRGRHLDPEIELYSRVPGAEVLGVVPNYFKDWESCDYGCILRWRNPIDRYPFLRPFSGPILDRIYRRDRRRRRAAPAPGS
ncbi:MAG: hypothetical protein AAGA93_11050 [Actinomycetota bacterium]